MSSLELNTILIVEPRKELAQPYAHLPQDVELVHLQSTQKAAQFLATHTACDLVIINASYSPQLILKLLETVKEHSSQQLSLVPIIFLVDLKNENNYIPGTFWGQKLGLVSSLSTQKELKLILERICQQKD